MTATRNCARLVLRRFLTHIFVRISDAGPNAVAAVEQRADDPAPDKTGCSGHRHCASLWYGRHATLARALQSHCSAVHALLVLARYVLPSSSWARRRRGIASRDRARGRSADATGRARPPCVRLLARGAIMLHGAMDCFQMWRATCMCTLFTYFIDLMRFHSSLYDRAGRGQKT